MGEIGNLVVQWEVRRATKEIFQDGWLRVSSASSALGFESVRIWPTPLLPAVAAASSIGAAYVNSAVSSMQNLLNNMNNFTATYSDATDAASALNSIFANLATIQYNSQKTSQILANQSALISSGQLAGTPAQQSQFFTDIQTSGVAGFQGLVSAQVQKVAAIIQANGGWPSTPETGGTGKLTLPNQGHLELASFHFGKPLHPYLSKAACASLTMQAGECFILGAITVEAAVGTIFILAAGLVALELALLCP